MSQNIDVVRDTFKPFVPKVALPRYEGRVKLELKRDGKVVDREEGKNDLTPWVAAALNRGNWNYLMDPAKLIPIEQWFEGCLLTDKAGDPTSMMIAHDATVIAQANQSAYSGTNLRRGSGNSNYTQNIPGGKRFVFDWSQPQGCGDIRAIHLTRGVIGGTDITDGSIAPDAGAVELMRDTFQTVPSVLNNMVNLIDLDDERAYYIYYENSKIYIAEYSLNTYRYHLTGNPGDAIELIDTHEISQEIANYAMSRCSFSYTGDYIYIFNAVANSSTLDEYKIALADWSCTKTSHTYLNFTFGEHFQAFRLPKDVIPVIDGYIYTLNAAGNKIAKIELADDSNIVQYDCPVSVYNRANMDGPSLILPNGDFYKFSADVNKSEAIYFHNDQFFRASATWRNNVWGWSVCPCISIGNFGTALAYSGQSNVSEVSYWIDTLYPFVSTCYNLSSKKTKTSDMTMTLTYEIAETQN